MLLSSRQWLSWDPSISFWLSVEPGTAGSLLQPADYAQPQMVQQAGSSAAAQPTQQPVQVIS